ncbi:uncharacterized protein A1O9_08801 [Exophiala aquamarina CBS 119918]|uniref:Dynamin GTPase n=1 Tax=Exophiala aquamarina CBS 119918 TaxID=1182545 RepID=A0A072P5Z7_9EURO|nr:uncharacterized protein A1O9_08801 [Exophiala aquamarina CBS 119918]KEF55147.1 hypothetical protein A1O9_08801 [Exophiala aquamarina CBS 119918]
MAVETTDYYDKSDQLPLQVMQLQSKDHEEILNVIDQLRSEGIGRYINLPQLIVCGDQSSGKSSVLEAISGLGFPIKDNLCTRFATELILRRSPNLSVIASIHPDEDRPVAEKARIRQFKSSTVDLRQFAAIVNEAEKHIGVGQDGHAFSKDILRVEVSGPTQPHLTLVDLPGLYHAHDEFQSAEGVDFVESLVLSYIQNERSVILAVISAKSDIALQKVTAFTRKVDPKGNRTMGIITKPDTLPEDSDMERSFLQLAMNKRVPFRLGWHALRNRDHKERHFSLDQRREKELEYFASGIWASLRRSSVGIDSLTPRLSTVLRDHILSELPGLIAETQQSIRETATNLERLGESRQTIADQRRYLLHSSEKFTTLMADSINGFYIDSFFGDAMEVEGYQRRLRAIFQNRLSDFSETLERQGMQRTIVEDEEEDKPPNISSSWILRSSFVSEVIERMRRSRGRELPGTFNPLIVGDLFYLQSRPWESITRVCIDQLLGDVQRAILPMLRYVLDEVTLTGLRDHVLNPALDEIEKAMRRKSEELLKPQQAGHPITYNHYFTDNVQKARADHLRKSMTERLKKFFDSQNPYEESAHRQWWFRMDHLIDALTVKSNADMEHFAASEAVDCMQAYYKVARKKFVDDFSILAVEKCLLEPLAVIFSPHVADRLADDVIGLIASEDTSTKNERGHLQEKLTRMQDCMNKLRRLDRYNLSASRIISGVLDHDSADLASGGHDHDNVEVENQGEEPDDLIVGAETDCNRSEKAEEIPFDSTSIGPRPSLVRDLISSFKGEVEEPPSSASRTRKKKAQQQKSLWEDV